MEGHKALYNLDIELKVGASYKYKYIYIDHSTKKITEINEIS
jgi:hypothetical protein